VATSLDPAVLLQIAGKFDSNSSDMRTLLNQIRDEVDATRPYWGGRAGMGFQSANEMWGTQQNDLLNAFNETSQSLRDYANAAIVANQQAGAPFGGGNER
jgi:WXG100 family type VII secretion target